ncbi:MAG: tRNA lysidine(34) synthetase TilS [Halothiobacillaceae bacterium]
MKTNDRSLIEAILSKIPHHLRRRPFLVAYSGGLDSTVLLHILSRLRDADEIDPIAAMHVHHGVHPLADDWVRYAQAFAQTLGIPLMVDRIQLPPEGHGSGFEAAAREARYQALASRMEEGGVLLTAHHRDDQAETFLLQLMRGAGVRGLASMPALAPFARGWHLRPMLEFGRQEIHTYALEHGLRWVEDPSNADPRHARNLIRHHVMPVLHRHWPKAEATLARAAQRMAITEVLLHDLGRIDLEGARSEQANRLDATALARLPDQRLFNAVRTWLIELDLPLPPEPRLIEVRRMLDARADALPILRWKGGELRRWRNGLYARPNHDHARVVDASFSVLWDATTTLDCAEIGWRIIPRKVVGAGIRLDALPMGGLRIRLRQGGEKIQVVGQAYHQSLKNLFQSSSIPPWERKHLPLFFIDEQLVQVGDRWIDASYAARPGETGLDIILQRLD